MILPWRTLGVVEVILKREFEKATGLPKRLRNEIEQFFVSATCGKDPKIEGWRGPKAALAVVNEVMRKA